MIPISLYDQLGPWPDWLTSLRPQQDQALVDIMDLYDTGVKVVFLSAPTGVGKTIIGEGVRRYVNGTGTFTCSTRSLQRQFIKDFPDSRLLEGRGNYTPLIDDGLRTCEDCDYKRTSKKCTLCSPVWECPYRVAKAEAEAADMAVLNTSYLLHAMKYAGAFIDRDITIIDEGDLITDALCDFAGTTVTHAMMKDCKLKPPSNVSDIERLNELLPDWCEVAADRIERASEGFTEEKKKNKWASTASALRVIGHNKDDVLWIVEGVDSSNKKNHPAMTLKAVQSRPVAYALMDNVDLVLIMSATIVSAALMAHDLGLEKGEYGVVRLDSPFAPERRLIVAPQLPVLTSDVINEGIPERTIEQFRRILEVHGSERILIHAPSYKLCDQIRDMLQDLSPMAVAYTYREASQREATLDKWLNSDSGILISPSFARGLDLKGDMCRTQIVFKLAVPNLGNPQVKARLFNTEGGQAWMALHTVREFIQAAGRVCRSEDDLGITYVLDGKFHNLVKRWPNYFEPWFTDAIITDTRRSKGKRLLEAYQAVGGGDIAA